MKVSKDRLMMMSLWVLELFVLDFEEREGLETFASFRLRNEVELTPDILPALRRVSISISI